MDKVTEPWILKPDPLNLALLQEALPEQLQNYSRSNVRLEQRQLTYLPD